MYIVHVYVVNTYTVHIKYMYMHDIQCKWDVYHCVQPHFV